MRRTRRGSGREVEAMPAGGWLLLEDRGEAAWARLDGAKPIVEPRAAEEARSPGGEPPRAAPRRVVSEGGGGEGAGRPERRELCMESAAMHTPSRSHA